MLFRTARATAVRRTGARRTSARRTVAALLAVATIAVTVLVASGPADAAKPQPFRPGLIISDDSFYNYFSMTAGQIQEFLGQRNCLPKDDSPCLANYRETTRTIAADPGHCAAYHGGYAQRASTIIWQVARACQINPQVLIVLIQKEQSLVSRPSAIGYQRATGYACPDSADCDARFFGFFNQVYRAAWQFREYGDSDGWRYHVGIVDIQYNPDPACGSSGVDIRNQATANLYNYTPYQPNTATIAASSDAPAPRCAAFGNLNFSRIFTGWFGSPLIESFPSWWGSCLNFTDGKNCSSTITTP